MGTCMQHTYIVINNVEEIRSYSLVALHQQLK